MKKRIIAFATALICMQTSAFASILGSTWVDGSSLLIGRGTSLYKNTFLSDQSGVGLQSEYYAEYTPNSDAVPTVVTGESIWGKRNISEVMEYMENNGMCPMVGINASFFSFQYGVPMGHVITDGIITSKDDTTLDAVGFYEDGNAFISKLGIKTTAYFDEYEFDVPHINKYCQAVTNVMTLYTNDFGENTHAATETINVVLGNLEGSLSIGGEISGTIEEITTAPGAVDIPDGKIVMTVPKEGDEWVRTIVNLMSAGEKIIIKSEAVTDADKWNFAYNGLGSEGKRLLENGNVCSGLEAGAAPRTAVGITENGNVIFYVIDGRQTNYSYGVQQKTLAQRLKELGCVDALNLDGGGSTSIAGVYPGQSAASIINSPSEGSLRKVTNFIFLRNTKEKSDELGGLYLYPYSTHYLSGTSVQLYPAAVDSNFRYLDVPEVEYYTENEFGSITEDGVLTLSGTGEAVVGVKSGDITGGATYFTYETPTSMTVYDRDTGDTVKKISGDAKSRISLSAHAYYGKKYLESEPKAYNWQIDEKLGTVTEDGVLTLSSACGQNGELTVWAGDTVVKISVSINEYAEDACYPASEYISDEGFATADFYSEKSPIDIDNCSFKIDGKEYITEAVKSKIDENTIRVSVAVSADFESEFHKLSLKVQNTDGFASYNTKSIERETNNIFADTIGHWASDRISYLNQKGIVSGSDGYYYPENSVTRAEFAIMLCNYLGINAEDYKDTKINFADNAQIPPWALNYVKAMTENGIISGKDNGGKTYFAPNDYITRAEAASMTVRIKSGNLKIRDLNYSDASEVPQWALKNMKIAVTNGFMGGYPDGTVLPNGNITRAEAASVIYNMI